MVPVLVIYTAGEARRPRNPRTAQRWMRREGFRYMKHQKEIYVDGHECPDAVEYRQKVFIPTIRSYQPRIV